MRMWMINPKLLCRKHLLGEHGEIHKHRHNFEKQHSMTGRIGQIWPSVMDQRHDELAKEITQRGWNHKSPYELPNLDYLPYELRRGFPDQWNLLVNYTDLGQRCNECWKRLRLALWGNRPEWEEYVFGQWWAI